MKKQNLLYMLNFMSWIALIIAAFGRMFVPEMAAWVFLVAALILAVTQFLLRVRGGNFVLKRLVLLQQISGIVLVAAGVLMFTHTRNEWIVAMFVGALLQLYTVFRIPQEMDKQEIDG